MLTYNIALKRVYKKPQISTVRKNWSFKSRLDTGVAFKLLKETNLASRSRLIDGVWVDS